MWKVLRKAGAVVVIVSALSAGIWFLVHQDERISAIEIEMRALSSSVGVGLSPMRGGSVIAPENPLLGECADLAKRAADAISQDNYFALGDLRDEMKQLNCNAAAR
jgi:hypothetical protein